MCIADFQLPVAMYHPLVCTRKGSTFLLGTYYTLFPYFLGEFPVRINKVPNEVGLDCSHQQILLWLMCFFKHFFRRPPSPFAPLSAISNPWATNQEWEKMLSHPFFPSNNSTLYKSNLMICRNRLIVFGKAGFFSSFFMPTHLGTGQFWHGHKSSPMEENAFQRTFVQQVLALVSVAKLMLSLDTKLCDKTVQSR